MPPVGLAWLLKPELLGNDEVVQLVRITVAESSGFATSGSPGVSRCCARDCSM
jgi:hypothetical protein